MSLETPILFLVFNRLDTTVRVFERIREMRPKHLYIAADGPRKSHAEDQAKCVAVREAVLNQIDWECELKTLFRDHNLGCGVAPAQAISWFFDQVEEGIILEDDCLPTISFFEFCGKLLNDYRNDTEIMCISGYNVAGIYPNARYDYFFSDGGIWGWASWKRAWKLFDFDLKSWPLATPEQRSSVKSFYPDFDSLYKKLTSGQNDVWDIQWHYARLFYNGLSITPCKNLVQNIGFGVAATHTLDEGNRYARLKAYEMDVDRPLRVKLPRALDLRYRKFFFDRTSLWVVLKTKVKFLLSYFR